MFHVEHRLAELAERHGLPAGAATRLMTILTALAAEPAAVTGVRDPARGVDAHVADSLVALEVGRVRDARRITDLGSGSGFPGLALAVALPTARVALVESVGRKCEFLRRVVDAAGLGNAEVVHARAEDWPQGAEAHDLVTARALASLPVVLEYAAPLMAPAGTLVAWKGRPEPAEEADARAAASILGLTVPTRVDVQPFAGVSQRSLYVSSKVNATPGAYPRRPGMARKRPLRASTRA